MNQESVYRHHLLVTRMRRGAGVRTEEGVGSWGAQKPYGIQSYLLRLGDWRHCYVGLEGPVVPCEKVLGPL